MPWLIQENPNIDWAARAVKITRRGVIHTLPTVRQAVGGANDELDVKVNCISAKAFKRAIRKKKIKEDTVFLGLILLYSVAALPGGLPRRCHGDY